VLINLAILDRLDLFGALDRMRFVIPAEVLAEVKKPDQKSRLRTALEVGYLQEVSLDQPSELSQLLTFRKQMKMGEASCLTLAVSRGWLFACDEKRIVRSEAKRLLGPDRILNTPGLFLLAIRTGYWTAEEAEEARAVLEENRYRMEIGPFRELL
jgi:predicted nucleic acid-binding protein